VSVLGHHNVPSDLLASLSTQGSSNTDPVQPALQFPSYIPVSQTPPRVPKSPFTIPLAPTTCITPMTEDEDMFYNCLLIR
jgi:hypothetical protein